MSAQTDCWGPHRSSVEDRLTSCEDYLGRFRRSIRGEIAPDLHYFSEKAHELRDASQALVDHVADIEWWLGTCDELTEEADPVTGLTSVQECGRAAGHEGRHIEAEGPERRALVEVRSTAAALRAVTDRLGWGLLTVRAEAGVTDAPSLAAELRGVLVRLASAASALEALRPSAPAERTQR